MPNTPIRTKNVNIPYITCPPGNGGGSGCVSHDNYVDIPIRDWAANPINITAPAWTIGSANPAYISLQITFPELEFIYLNIPNFRYKIKKTFTGVDFVYFTSNTPNTITGNVFNNFDLVQETIKINFQNVNNLAPGVHTMYLEIEAYGVDSAGNEIFKETSADYNIIIPVSITVLSGNGFNTDKNTYQLIYNIADGSLSGDAKIIVYSTDPVTTGVSDPFIELAQTAGASERYLTFQNNTILQGKPVGNYSGMVTITKGTQSKTVDVNLQVINDATQFYINPVVFNTSLQKNLSESKTVTANVSNPNNLNLSIEFFPSFIDTVTISNNVVTIVTKNSGSLALGNYSGDIILKSGTVQKTITVNMTVLQGIIHNFSGSAYYFAMDKNKVVVNKTNSNSAYVKMTLNMYFKGYGKEHQESQIYTFPFFQGSAEIYPGEEIQDFFIKCKELASSSDPLYEYDLALVTMLFQEMSGSDTVISSFTFDNVLFAAGRKPKCFPFFTDFPIRSTYSESIIKISYDRLSEKADANQLYNQYNLPQPSFTPKFTIDQYSFLRNEFHPDLMTKIVSNDTFQFVPLPDPESVVHIEWENQNLVFDWFTAVEKTKEASEIENVTGESKMYKEEKFSSTYSRLLTVNSGWILEEEIELITDLLMSRLCFVTIKGKRYNAFPIGKKNELKDSDNNKYSIDLEFKILIEK